jgi:hypothetical protein
VKEFDEEQGAQKVDRAVKIIEKIREIAAAIHQNGTMGDDTYMGMRKQKMTSERLSAVEVFTGQTRKAQPKPQHPKDLQVHTVDNIIRDAGCNDSYGNDYDDCGSNSSDSSSGSSEEWFCWEYVSYNWEIEFLEDIYYEWDFWRVWVFQTCNQWGYAMSTNYGYNVFESSLPINHLLDMCPDIFGDDYNRTRVDLGVNNMQVMYGGADAYNGTNVFFVNGSEDPWHYLSVYTPLNPDTVTSLLIPGTSHCQDMYAGSKDDIQVLKDARVQIKAQVSAWVENSKP